MQLMPDALFNIFLYMSRRKIMEKAIIIGGGVGPMAGVELHRRIIEQTLTDGTDQSHLEVLHFSRSNDIVDRTEYLFGKVKGDPAEGMFRTFKMAYRALEGRDDESALQSSARQNKFLENSAGNILHKPAVGGIPCNTFHAGKIFNRFIELLKVAEIDIYILNMIEETVKLIDAIAPKAYKIGLMSTTGTRRTGIYNEVLVPKGFNLIEIPEELQDELHDSIYNRKWGIKAVSPITVKARTNFQIYAKILADKGAEAIILGCTEIPIALPKPRFQEIPLIDPMTALARGLIREANPDKLKPF